MSVNKQKSILSTLKTVIIAGYAVSLFVPYKVEKHDGEITYHAPLYKLAYKTSKTEKTDNAENEGTQEPKKQIIHTYTVTSFGLLNDQIMTAQRLYKAALLKRPAIEEKVRKKAKGAVCKAKQSVNSVKKKTEKISLSKLVNDIID